MFFMIFIILICTIPLIIGIVFLIKFLKLYHKYKSENLQIKYNYLIIGCVLIAVSISITCIIITISIMYALNVR